MNKLRHEAGMSLVSVLLGAAGLGFLALTASQMNLNSTRSTKATELRDDRVGIRQSLRHQLDCDKTLTGVTCNGSAFALRNANGGVIGTSQFGVWRLGEFHIRGTCDSSTLLIQTARLTGVDQFALHPLSRQPESWSSLFVPGELDCANWFTGRPGGIRCAAGEFVTGLTSSGRPICQAFADRICPTGEAVIGIMGGEVICRNVASAPSQGGGCPSGYTNHGTAFNGMTACFVDGPTGRGQGYCYAQPCTPSPSLPAPCCRPP